MAPDKQFIIDHMNADHQESLSLYLQAYCHVSANASKSARLEDITLSDLLITTSTSGSGGGGSKTRYSVPFTPAMESLAETRPRVVAMNHEALARLGLSDIAVPEYRLPRGLDAILFIAGLTLPLVFARQAHFEPGGVAASLLSDGARQVVYDWQPVVLPGILVTHALEAAAFAVLRLRVHRVRAFSGAWWAWMATVMVEGGFAWKWFAAVVRDERVRQKHSK